MNNMVKIDRIASWVLFLGLTLYFITGYGLTKGIIDPSFSAKVHIDILSYIILVAFVLHTGYAIRLAFIRWGFWNSFGKIVWFLFYLLFIIFVIYAESFYTKNNIASTNSNQTSTNTNTKTTNPAQTTVVSSSNPSSSSSANNTTVNNTSENTTTEKTFTLEELATYNGKNGNPAYVAVDGIVYDMSTVFNNGLHYSHTAGQDLTSAFYKEHIKSEITKYPVVGKLQ